MSNQKLTELSIHTLNQKEQSLKIVLNIFKVVLLLLIGVLIIMIYRNGITPLIAVPIVLAPILLSSRKNLKNIRTEIETRKS